MQQRTAHRWIGGAGFTLIEMLVAVGAVALVGVAIAAVFSATGRTVSTGRRVGALNAYANLIKQQMEKDFASITREGFLVIRNEMADADGNGIYNPPQTGGSRGGDAIPLHVDDLAPRPRRIDELMFFAKGDFTTAREPLDPGFVARSDAARIYYGMGKRRRPDATPGSPYLDPRLDDPNNEANSWLGRQIAGNPNRFASEWTLLRQVTLLSPLQSTARVPAGYLIPALGISSAQIPDQDIQVMLQPAASNIFRALAVLFPTGPANVVRPNVRPFFSSGLVDIATTTLTETRLVVTTADTWPGSPPGGFPGTAAGTQFFDPTANGGPDGSNKGLDGFYRLHGTGAGQDPYVLARMQAWMSDALPTWSTAPNVNQRTRIRYEPEPPNYLGVIGDPNLTALAAAYSRADQLMLSSSNFLPRCTEFIVEWSFGRAYTSDSTASDYRAGHEGELIWHGMERLNDGTPAKDNVASVVRPYAPGYLTASPWKPRAAEHRLDYRELSGSIKQFTVKNELIHGQGFAPANLSVGEPITSYFGYTDPTFNPDQDNDGRLESGSDAASPTIPWAWPKLIRVTIGLADPIDPTIEQRFQLVFSLPDEPGP
jgi:type II secretory pathway pseudopilin PulG